MTTRPAIIIPPALKLLAEHKRWLIWRWEQKDNGEWTKVPYQGHATSRHADTTDPKTWCYVKSAMLAYTEGRCDGIGYVLTDGDISGIDIDDCRNATTGELHPWAAEQITRSNSYVEVTPSNEGVRIIGLSNGGIPLNNPYTVPNTNVSGELYRRPAGRFITITGNQMGAATELVNIDAQLDMLVPLLVTEPGGGGGRPKQAGGKFGAINERALANLGAWVPQLFPTAKRTRKGGYRVTSADLGRGFEEDLSLTPQGIKWFGIADQGDPREGRRTPIEVIVEFQHVEAPQAAEWLEKALSNNDKEPPPPPPEPPPEPEPTDADVEITRLAKLSVLEYEQQRKEAADKLDVRASILDRLVRDERVRLGLDGDDKLQGSAVSFEEIEPWPEPVNGAELLNDIATAIRSHVVMSDCARDISTLWTVHTYLIRRFKISPKNWIRSPVKRCGKSTLIEVLAELVFRAWTTGSITKAALFRVIDKWHPTLLIDEVDTFVGEDEELRGILNQSHRYDGSVTRTEGDDHEPRRFSVYAAVALSGIGGIAETLVDRSVIAELQRRRPSEAIVPLRIGRVGHLHELRRRITRWVADHEDRIAERDPEMPSIIDREADNWHVLLAIADEAEGEWPERARKAAEAAHIAAADDPGARLELLLGDIRSVFANKGTEVRDMFGADQVIISSAKLVKALIALEGRPWAETGKDRKPLTQNKLASMLRPLGIASGKVGPENARLQGYKLSQFEDAFARYLSPEGVSNRTGGQSAANTGTSDVFKVDSQGDGCPDAKCEKPNNDGLLSTCPVTKGGTGAKTHMWPTGGKSDDLPYTGPVVEVPDLGPDQIDEHGAPVANGGNEPGLSQGRIRELAHWYLDRATVQNEESETGDVSSAELDAALREVLREEVFPEFVEVEFERVMKAVFAV
jgi:putative DNA primase/helicase